MRSHLVMGPLKTSPESMPLAKGVEGHDSLVVRSMGSGA